MAKKITRGVPVEKLDQEVNDLGVRAKVYRSTLCPHMSSIESLDTHLNCTACNNNMLDFDPIETIVMFQQQMLQEQFTVQGTFHIDEVQVTFPSGITVAPFALVELLDFEEDFYELIPRQVGKDIDILKYRACSVQGLFTVDSTTSVVTRYHRGTDFKINQDGNIEWMGTHRPADKQIYTVYYKYNPKYRAIKAIHRDRFSQDNTKGSKSAAKVVNGNRYVKLPESWILKRDYLLEERGQNEDYDPNT